MSKHSKVFICPVNVNESVVSTVRDLNPGDFFLYKEDLYISRSGLYEVRLSDGIEFDLNPNHRIKIVDVNITYQEH